MRSEQRVQRWAVVARFGPFEPPPVGWAAGVVHDGS